MTTLIHLPYSPWSERARWALDARAVPHARKVYMPLLGELGLKAKIGWSQRASVPVLLTDAGPLTDGLEIARFCQRTGSGAALITAEQDAAAAEWNQRSNAVLEAARGLSLPRMAASDEALVEMIPKGMRPLAPLGARALSRYGVLRTIQKYGATASPEQYMATLRSELAHLRASLGPTPADGPATLLGTFSYADIAAAQMLVPVGPHVGPYLRIGPASRACWTIPEIAQEFSDLLAWRDALYATYRQGSKAAQA